MSKILEAGSRARVLLAFAIIVGMLSASLTVRAAEHHTATRTPTDFSFTRTAEVDAGESWIDEAGVSHVRDQVWAGEISGDVTGTASVTINADVEDVSAIFCPEDAALGCSVVFSFTWGQVEIEGEDGRWRGRFAVNEVTAEGVEPEELPVTEFASLFLQGEGGSAHDSIAANIVSASEDLSELDFVGIRSSLATPIAGQILSASICANEDGTVGGGFQASGLVETSGAVAAFAPISSGGRWTHEQYGLWGSTTLEDEHGSLTVDFLATATDVFSIAEISSIAWGQFIVVDGTGAYAELYGHGRFIGSANERPDCASGFGYRLSFIGEAHMNPMPEQPEPKTDAELAEERWLELQAEDYQATWSSLKGDLYRGQGPHGLLLTTYLNPSAEEAKNSQPGVMPDDAVIVKENYTPDGELDSLTVMFKDPGYNPERGDWFFAKYFPDGSIDVAGTPDGCVSCHGAARSNDYVYSFPIAPIQAEMIPPTDDELAMATEQWQMLQAANYQESWSTVPGKGELYTGQPPHGALLSTYLNAEAEQGAEGPDAMPEGAIIVKENYTADAELDSLTVMSKVAGYDAEHNDWFWTKFSAEGDIQAAGRAAGCISCHGAMETNDFVFTFPVQPIDPSSPVAETSGSDSATLVSSRTAVLSVPFLAIIAVLGLRYAERRGRSVMD